MKDSDTVGDDGFFVQEYTIHIGKPIIPDNSLKYNERLEQMMNENFAVWKEIYEREYHMPLEYITE